MSIGTAERPINIKDLILDTPERELPFDPEKEITEEEWQWVARSIRRLPQDFHSPVVGSAYITEITFLGMAVKAKLLFPRRASDLGIDAAWGTLNEWEKFFHQDVARPDDPDQDIYRDFFWLQALKLLSPERFESSAVEDTLVEKTHKEMIEGKRRDFEEVAIALRILSPEISLSGPYVDRKRQILQNGISGRREEGAWLYFAQEAADFRLLFPEHFQEVSIDETAWEAMKTILHKIRNEADPATSPPTTDPGKFLGLAYAMKILAADEAKINDQGLIEITMRKPKPDFAPPTPPMPEVRRF